MEEAPTRGAHVLCQRTYKEHNPHADEITLIICGTGTRMGMVHVLSITYPYRPSKNRNEWLKYAVTTALLYVRPYNVFSRLA
jgi:hypothetical protein